MKNNLQDLKPISRIEALERIETLYHLIQNEEEQAIEDMIQETGYNIHALFVNFERFEDNFEKFNNFDNWTDDMIIDQINKPFFRKNLFEYYFLQD